MKTSLKIVFISLFLTGIFSCTNNDNMQVFNPIVVSEDKFVEDKNIETGFYNNLEKVLRNYQIKYQWKNNVIYVKKDIYKDKEMMWNFTQKARDKKWLLTH